MRARIVRVGYMHIYKVMENAQQPATLAYRQRVAAAAALALRLVDAGEGAIYALLRRVGHTRRGVGVGSLAHNVHRHLLWRDAAQCARLLQRRGGRHACRQRAQEEAALMGMQTKKEGHRLWVLWRHFLGTRLATLYPGWSQRCSCHAGPITGRPLWLGSTNDCERGRQRTSAPVCISRTIPPPVPRHARSAPMSAYSPCLAVTGSLSICKWHDPPDAAGRGMVCPTGRPRSMFVSCVRAPHLCIRWSLSNRREGPREGQSNGHDLPLGHSYAAVLQAARCKYGNVLAQGGYVMARTRTTLRFTLSLPLLRVSHAPPSFSSLAVPLAATLAARKARHGVHARRQIRSARPPCVPARVVAALRRS